MPAAAIRASFEQLDRAFAVRRVAVVNGALPFGRGRLSGASARPPDGQVRIRRSRPHDDRVVFELTQQ